MPETERIANGGCGLRFRRQLQSGIFQPSAHGLKQRPGTCVADLAPFFRGTGRVIAVQLVRTHHIATEGFHQGVHELAGFADPPRQNGSIQIHSFAGIDLSLSIQRDMISVLGCDDVREHAGTRKTAVKRP